MKSSDHLLSLTKKIIAWQRRAIVRIIFSDGIEDKIGSMFIDDETGQNATDINNPDFIKGFFLMPRRSETHGDRHIQSTMLGGAPKIYTIEGEFINLNDVGEIHLIEGEQYIRADESKKE